MAFESHRGADIWSNNLPADYDANYWAAGKFALAVGAVGGAGLAAYSLNGNDLRPTMDYMSQKMRRAGSFTPFQLMNTFRVPEFMSFFTSMEYKTRGYDTVDGVLTPGESFYEWQHAAIKNEDTADYVSRITGKSRRELSALGYEPTRIAALTSEEAKNVKIRFEDGKLGIGKLFFSDEKGTTTLLSDNIMVGAYSQEIDVKSASYRSGEVNKATEGIMRALGVGEQPGDSINTIFRADSNNPARLMPVPSIIGPLNSFDDLNRRTSYVRGFYSFGANRFNELMETFVDTVGGDTGKDFLRNVLGVNPKVKGGSASALVARYAGRTVAAGALFLGAEQLDWMRRQGPGGEVFASAAFSGVGAYALHRMGHNRLAVMGGVASFFGQLIAPGFDQGIMPGIATTAASLDVMRAAPINPFNHYRRTVEGLLPGFTGIEATAGFGVLAVMAGVTRNPFNGKTLAEYLTDKHGNLTGVTAGGIHSAYGVPREALSATDLYWSRMNDHMVARGHGNYSVFTGKERNELFKAFQKAEGKEADEIANQLFLRAEREHKEIMQSSMKSSDGVNFQLLEKLKGISGKYNNAGFSRSVLMNLEGFAAQTFYSVFGADAAYDKEMRSAVKSLGFRGPVGSTGRLLTLATAGMAIHSLISGNLLGSLEDSKELSDIYSGRKMVEVKEGRYWEAGGTPYEGGNTSYFRPHQLALMKARTRERATWGEDEDQISPIEKFFLKNFTYELEKRNYYNRPYQMTGAAFQDVPIIGHLLAATIGSLIKPSRVMHADEWMRQDENGNLEYASLFKGSKIEPAYELGATKPGVPVSPLQATELAKQTIYQFRELEGMTGWGKNIVQQLITGSAQPANPHQVIATANEIDSSTRAFWDASMGGFGFTNELFRRLLPPQRSGLTKQNAIRNDMPYWLPDKFHFGDPYTKVQWGEARLPGAGYAALHPELQGVDPNSYPLIARYAILGDVAPTSYEFNQLQRQVFERRYQGAYTKEQEELIDQVSTQAAAVINRIDFNRRNEHAYRSPISDTTSQAYLKLLGTAREVVAPVEYMFPMGFRPMQKLTGHLRTPIEEYEHQRMYGTNMAFWDKPLRDWFRPALYSAAHLIGYDAKPKWRTDADAALAEWDKLEFVKWMRLAEQAKAIGDNRQAERYSWAASQTRTGVNPQGSPLSIYWALPEQDRAFFNAFANADGSERERVLEMVPKDQVHLYKAIWSRIDSGDPTVQYPSQANISKERMEAQYHAVVDNIDNMPPPDWIGWNAEVDMDDIKVRYAENHAMDLQDYGMWEKQLKKSMNQEFLEGADYVVDSPNAIMANEVRNMLGSFAGRESSFYIANITGPSRVSVRYDDNRESSLQSKLKQWGF